MKDHTEIINYIIEQKKLKSYCEIGTFNRDHNFNKINCVEKVCIDPDKNADADWKGTSDSFFELLINRSIEKGFDLYFIDGLHEEKQVEKDFMHARVMSNPDTYIVLHDTNPHSENIAHYPRDNREWCGTVYKFAARLKEWGGIDFITLSFDYGITVVRSGDNKPQNVEQISWEYFDKNRKELLNIVDIEGFKSWLEKNN